MNYFLELCKYKVSKMSSVDVLYVFLSDTVPTADAGLLCK